MAGKKGLKCLEFKGLDVEMDRDFFFQSVVTCKQEPLS
ncbi:hypothetical protein QG37_06699 [Candidozyma auris]|uniref:Uncharacterized protein n=1 Tax=Candidozyma auris TaxID=498019 RepID=A0A0L0NTL1_CANAR|nr:hypothetical protein QG37_06699 [[Candida] auris]